MKDRYLIEIDEAVQESDNIKTLRFVFDRTCIPGQFFMVWLPRIDEIPMSVSYTGNRKGITVKAVGEASRRLFSLGEGDCMWIRGPLGNGFSIEKKKTLCVGGGVGIAALLPAAEAIGDPGLVDIAIGATTSSEIIFEKRARRAGSVMISTDDGSAGFKGTVVELVSPLISSGRYEMIMACGPERMLASLLSVCAENGVECQFSLERFVKCGAGLCGSCAVDGMRVCADGPVFSGAQLLNMSEFGKIRRDPSGRRIPI